MYFAVLNSLFTRKTMYILADYPKAKTVKKRAEQGAPEQTDDGVVIYSEFVCEEQRSSARNFDGLTGWQA